MSSLLCHAGLHSWPRVHGFWREVVVAPADAECRHCNKPLHSVWRSVYPEDGSKCTNGSCPVHQHA